MQHACDRNKKQKCIQNRSHGNLISSNNILFILLLYLYFQQSLQNINLNPITVSHPQNGNDDSMVRSQK